MRSKLAAKVRRRIHNRPVGQAARHFALFVLSAMIVFSASARTTAQESEKKEPPDGPMLALKAVDAFLEAFNARDVKAWAKTLNYPHTRFADGLATTWATPEDYASHFNFDEFAKRFEWHHSVFDKKEVVQAGDKKIHIAVKFTRLREDGSKIASYQALYVVTLENKHWGIKARSSFAPL